jgi:Polyketide cyclase / dehydrase and lipid transport
MSRQARGAVRIEVERWFEVSVREAFNYITDPANWPEYWPRFVRLAPDSRWREPDDRARLTLRMLAREVELEMTLSRIEPYRVVEYTSTQRGLPAARHWRHFDKAGGGLAYRIVIEYSPRAGWRGMLDRTVVRLATTRTARTTMANLERRFREQRRHTDGAAGVPDPRARG